MRAFFTLFLLQAFGFGFQPARVITLMRNSSAAVQFEYPASYIVEELAIVGDGDNGSGKVM